MGDVEGDDDINCVVFMSGENEKHSEDIQHPRCDGETS